MMVNFIDEYNQMMNKLSKKYEAIFYHLALSNINIRICGVKSS
jgi:hypothetical protein